MAGEDDNSNSNPKQNNEPKSIVESATNAINKARKDQATDQIKAKLKVKAEHLKAIKLIDKEIAEIVEDFNEGL